MAELGYCFQESVSALELQGVTGSCFVENQGNISLSESIQLYDAFQSVLQKTFEKHLSESGLCEQNRAFGFGNTGKACITEKAGKLNYIIMCVIIFGTRFRVPLLFFSEISYFWGKINKKRCDNI